jgi:fermentation-respiration switch protein FrsA (DUF1100 family)
VQQRSFIYIPNTNPPIANLDVDTITVCTADGLDLNGWYSAPRDARSPVILFFHGNSGNIQHRQHKFKAPIARGMGVLMAEYRGYGGNAGSPTEDGLYADARAYYAWLIARGIDPSRIIVYGESLGTGVATQLLSEQPAAAMILETPYARLSDPAQDRYFFIPFIEILMHDKFRSIDKVGALDIPKLFILAGQDEVLGTQTGLELYEAAAEPKRLELLEDAAHNNAYNHGAGDAVLAFIDTVMGKR